MFQQTFSNALDSSSPYAQQPSHLKTSLRLHQLTALAAMKEKEHSLRAGHTLPSGETIFSKYAILGDRVGVGKTLMTLGHISQMAREPLRAAMPMSNLHTASTSSFFSITDAHAEETVVYDSLIIVPHTIFRQWHDSIESYTTLTCNALKSQRDIDRESFITNVRGSHITLISNTLLPAMMNAFKLREISPTWRRVFYDEADTIKIPGTCPIPSAHMSWLITASFSNLLFVNEYYHSYILRQLPDEYVDTLHPELQQILHSHIASHPSVNFFKTLSYGFFLPFIKSAHPLRAHLVIRNSEAFLQESINMPPLLREVVVCQTPVNQQIVRTILTPETEAMLHAGDVQGALISLGVPSHTHLTIVEAATAARQRDIERLQRLLKFKSEETYANEAVKAVAIANLEKKITSFQEQIITISKRIEEASKDSCAICFDPPSKPCITPCCSKLFCGKCILECMTRSTLCPLCRTTFNVSDLCALGDTYIPSKPVIILPKKMEALVDILAKNPTGKFILYSRYNSENTQAVIQDNTSHLNYTITTLQGNKDHIATMLADFAEGKIQVLLLNTRNAAAGMNISSASHIILLHKMNSEEEKQVLGRAYRMDRTTPLTIIQLLNENE